MQFFRLHSAARGAAVAIALVAWLVATNHCAFGLMRPSAQPAHAHCHGGAVDQKAPPQSVRECCKSIQGTPATGEAAFKAEPVQSVLAFFELEAVARAAVNDALLSGAPFEHDPPRVESFAEGVLQRSLLSHAPPR